MAERRFYEFGPFQLDPKGHLLSREGQVISLPPKAVDTLLVLVENAGNVVEKEEILRQVWQGAFVEEGSLTRTVSVLRKTLGNGEEGQEFIATVPKRGYRLAVPVRMLDKSVSGMPVLPPAPIEHKKANLARIAFAVISLIVLSSIVYFSVHYFSSSHSHRRQMIAVLPFENLTGDPGKDFVSDGLTEEMITELGAVNPEQLGVIARTSAMTYKGTTKPITQIGRDLNVQYILEGSVRSWGDRVRISSQLIQVSDQTHLWAENYDRGLGDILALQSDVSQAIAREIRVKLAPGKDRSTSATPINPEAYEAYLKGRYFWNKRTADGLRKGIDYFDQAIKVQPDYAPAYVGLADSYLMLAGRGVIPTRNAIAQAKTAAMRALQINSNMGEARASLAHIRLHDVDLAGLEDDFKKAVELNPANAFSYYYYSEYLETMGRPDESIAVVNRIREIDPVSPVLSTTLSSQYYFARRYDTALDLAQKAKELYPDYFLVHFRLGQIYIQKGMGGQAIQEMQKAVLLSGRSTEMLAALAQANAVAGMRKEVQQLLDELNERSQSQYVSPYYVAKIYGSLGDKESALTWLERAYQDHSFDLIELKVEPCFDPLRSDPRFLDLLRRIGLN